MPEGDTLHRLAMAMGPRLEGQRIERVELEQVELTIPHGLVVDSVSAVGKHLLIFIGELCLRSHLGLHGSWHRYPVGARWKRPAWRASMVITTPDHVFVCFDASEVDCIKTSRLALHRPLKRLGSDLLADAVDFEEILEHARARPQREAVAKLLLDQTVASGVGNVYKSELLFLTRVAPATAIGRLSDEDLIAIYREARWQMRANVHRAHRSTTGSTSHRLWVYRRAGRACYRCSTTISFARMNGRSTYWCSACQPEARLISDFASASLDWRAR